MPILISGSLKKQIKTCLEPPVDVYRTPFGCVIKVELAGVALEDIEIELHGAVLSISGTRRDWIVGTGWQHHSMEISYCHFQREIALPSAEGGQVSSEYRHGMLLIHVAREGRSL